MACKPDDACALQDKPNGQHDKESKKPLNGQKIPEVVSDTPVKTRPFVLYAVLLMVLLGGAATGAYFAKGETPCYDYSACIPTISRSSSTECEPCARLACNPSH